VILVVGEKQVAVLDRLLQVWTCSMESNPCQ